MFCVYQGSLRIAESNTTLSHAEWFMREGWMQDSEDAVMDSVVRGIVDASENIHFYKGNDFRVDEDAESVFFTFLPDLVQKLKIGDSSLVFGGCYIGTPGIPWQPIKEYGCVADLLFSRQ